MNNTLLTIYPLLWFLLVFYKASFSGRGGRNSAFLRPEQTGLIRAAACIGVILHHVTQQISSYGSRDFGPIGIFNYLGILFTALFFFFSGFGLIASLYSRPDYLRHFLCRRLPPVLIPFWLINALGVFLHTAVYGARWTGRQILLNISGITLINSNGWFIVEITIFYLLFYLIFRLVRNRDAALVLLCMAVAGIMVFSFFQGHDPAVAKVHWFRGEWWYNSTISFIFGLVFARFRARAEALFRNRYAVLMGISSLLFVLTLRASIYCVRRYGYYRMDLYTDVVRNSAITLISQMAACIAFVIFVLLLNWKLAVGNRALRFLSGISRDLFLIHGYFVGRIFGSVRMPQYLRYAAVLSCSIACTALLSPCINYLVRLVTRLFLRAEAFVSERLQVAAAGSSDGVQSAAINSEHVQAESEGSSQSVHSAVFPGRVWAAEKRKKRRISGKTAVFGVLLGGVILLSFSLSRRLLAAREYAEECRTLQQASVGDEVLWGRWETDPAIPGKERLSWTVIAKEPGRVCLLSRFGIAGSYYHRKHEAVSWEESDLRKRMNSEEYTRMFSSYEMKSLLEEDGDYLTLLTAEQLMDLYPLQQDRVLAVTEAARRQGTNADRLSHYEIWFDQMYCYSWWWLRGAPGEKSITAPIVNMDGSVSMTKKPVNKPSGAVRPVLWVNPDL